MAGAHRRHQVDLNAYGPAGFIVAAAEARGVVDQDVDAAEILRGRFHPVPHFLCAGHVAGARADAMPERLQRGCRGLQRRRLPGADRHVRAGRGKEVAMA
jgi:hypothetical protein